MVSKAESREATNGRVPPDNRDIPIADNAMAVLERRYLRRGPDGKPAETVHEMFWRVASVIAEAERELGGDVEEASMRFWDLLTGLRFFPNSPTFTGAGTPLAQLAACFVLPIDDDMGRSGSGIFQTLRDAALIQQTGGGNGFAFSRLRPKGALVASSNGKATGPVGFLRVYDKAFGEIAQGGVRRGANMAVLRVDHPDIREFITCKTDENAITNFNISVGITDAFMRAVERDEMFDLVNPQDGKVWETARARAIFDLIVKQAHHNGEPGVLFLDAANRSNPVPHLYELEATNPCHRGTNLVHTREGKVPIRDLVGRDFEVMVADGSFARAVAYPTGIKPLYRVWFQDGNSIDLTARHNLILADGSKRMVQDLNAGDEIMAAPVMVAAVAGQTRATIPGRVSNPGVRVAAVEDLDIAELVFNLTVDHELHQFVVNGIVSANCGEQWLGPYENCCLGSINLVRHITEDRRLDWDKLRESVEVSTRFLDDVVTANAYVPAVPQLKEAAHRVRRIGLGIMGLGDLMYALRVRYGSPAGQELAAQVMEFVRFHCMRTSIELARQRGPFPAIKGSLYDPDDLKWTPPQPLAPYTHDWGRPALDWNEITDGIRRHGIRNGAQTTVAPTGTIATVAGCEGYGCEPVFALAYIRHVNDNGRDLELQYTSPQFEQALIDAGLDEATRQRIVEQVNLTGSCQDVEEVPADIRDVFVVSADITPEEHVYMQAAMQAFVDNSMSKTINFPADATEEDVAKAYFLAWKLGCKGLTVYVTGSRDKVVLETHETAKAKEQPAEPVQPLLFNEEKKPRPVKLPGFTYKSDTPLGRTFVTINENGNRQPFEMFMHTSKAGSETAAISEAMGRLISLILRMTSPVSPVSRLREVVRQLEGIGGGHPRGIGANRVRSLPDGVAQVLAQYLAERDEPGEVHPPPRPLNQMAMPIGDLCPECGQAAVVREEGCRKCYACGYSEC